MPSDSKNIFIVEEDGKYVVKFENEPGFPKRFETETAAEQYKQKYIVRYGLEGHEVANEYSSNDFKNVYIPKKIKFEKFNTLEIEENNLVIVAAKPGNGKTLFLMELMREALRKKYKCVMYSLEMSKGALRSRYNDDDDLIVNGCNCIIKAWDSATIENLENSLKYYNASYDFGKPDFIFIDYIQYISEDDENTIKDFAKKLKMIAKKFKIRIICAAQLNANFNITKPNDIVDAMSGSREISKTAEMIVVTWKVDDVFNLIVAKNRNGINGSETHLMFNLNKNTKELEILLENNGENISLRKEEILSHELGHNFIQYVFTGKVSPIITNARGGYVVGKKMSDEDQLKVLHAGLMAEHIIGGISAPKGHETDLLKEREIVKGMQLVERAYLVPDYNDEKEQKKFQEFYEKKISQLSVEVGKLLKESKPQLQSILNELLESEKSTYSDNEIKELFEKYNLDSKVYTNKHNTSRIKGK